MLASLFFQLFIYYEKISAAYFSKLVLRRKYYNFGVFVTTSVTKLYVKKRLQSVVLLEVISYQSRTCYFERSTIVRWFGMVILKEKHVLLTFHCFK